MNRKTLAALLRFINTGRSAHLELDVAVPEHAKAQRALQQIMADLHGVGSTSRAADIRWCDALEAVHPLDPNSMGDWRLELEGHFVDLQDRERELLRVIGQARVGRRANAFRVAASQDLTLTRGYLAHLRQQLALHTLLVLSSVHFGYWIRSEGYRLIERCRACQEWFIQQLRTECYCSGCRRRTERSLTRARVRKHRARHT